MGNGKRTVGQKKRKTWEKKKKKGPVENMPLKKTGGSTEKGKYQQGSANRHKAAKKRFFRGGKGSS